MMLPIGLDIEASMQKVRPSDVNIMMYDAGLTYQN